MKALLKLICAFFLSLTCSLSSANTPEWIVQFTHGKVNLAQAVKLHAQIILAARKYGVHPDLVFRMAAKESTFNPGAVSGRAKNCGTNIGLVQVNPCYHRKAIAGRNLYDPAVNLDVGVRYLAAQKETCGDNDECLLREYNRGPKKHAYAKRIMHVSFAMKRRKK